MKVSFHALAERELNEAARYYELESPGLGVAFLAEVEHSTARIVEHPDAAPTLRGRFVVACCADFRTGCCTVCKPTPFECWQ